MPFQHLTRIQVRPQATLKDVMRLFSETAIHTQGKGFGIVVDEAQGCIGVVTDGDIRRHLVEGATLETAVSEVMNRQFVAAKPGYSCHQILRLFDNQVRHIPVVDDNGRLVDLLQFADFTASARAQKCVIRARAPVRISFSGGGTDMTDFFRRAPGYVLSAAINKYCYASVRVRDDGRIRLKSHDFNCAVEAGSPAELAYGDALDLIKACVKLMEPSFGFDLETYSEIEPGTGLGGSSTMCAAVIGALNHFRNEKHLDSYAMADLGYQAERVELGVAGGWQDQYAAVFGGFNLMEFREHDIVVFPLKIAEDLLLELHYNLLLFRFGRTRDSGQILRDQVRQLRHDGEVLKRYQELSRLTLRMKDALLKGSLDQFGTMLHEGWELKKSFSAKISNDRIDDLYTVARSAGALGGKVLGAGGQGYLLLYCPPSCQRAMIDRLSERGARLEFFDFKDKGMETWTSMAV